MRSAQLVARWGVMITFLLGATALTSVAFGAEQNGISFVISKSMKFSEVVSMLSKESGINIIMHATTDPEISLVNYPNPTPVEKILSDVSASVGLDFWKSGDSYIIGKRVNTVDVPPKAVAPTTTTLPAPLPATTTPTTAPVFSTPDVKAFTTPTTTVEPKSERTTVVRMIPLDHVSAHEMAYMLGVSDVGLNDKGRTKAINERIMSLKGERKKINPTTAGDAYNSPAFSTPFVDGFSGNINRRGSVTDNYQILPPAPGPGPIGTPNPPTTNPAAPANPNNPTGAAGSGGLRGFIPAGVQEIIGLLGLNALLVRATGDTPEKAQEAIEQLEQLIKILDQPVKQVIVEAMFVKMEVKDAMSLGVSWDFAGMPVSMASLNGGNDGNFKIRFIQGNVRAALSTLIATSKAKVVNAPRVVVQNGGGANIEVTDTIPFIIMSEAEDVFGRTITTPDIELQPFSQGLTVNRVTIHPDDSVTLDVTPLLEAPGARVAIPGTSGSGSVSGDSTFIVETIVRVKNGETIMMGGFVNKNETVDVSKTPLLSNLPVIGPLLFRSTNKSWNSTETLLFLTPTVMKEDTTNFTGMQSLPPLF